MFEGIVPCGLSDRGVTSVLAETGRAHAVEDVARLAARHLGDVFERPVVWAAADSMLGKKSAASAGSR
jgi:lipoyl(octanoyl) transferase